jgi:threonine dehydrogenase-like Zn-dependent dehydrogenase
MKALALFPEKRDIDIISIPEPLLAPDRVLVRPLEVGICGTDRDLARFQFGYAPAGLDYLVLGHEMIGEIVEVGTDVEGFHAGDIVVPSVRRPCDDAACVPCRSGRTDMCFTGKFTERGIFGAGGFMTELVAEVPAFLTRVPASLRDFGVLLEPLSIVEKALEEMGHVQQRLPWKCPGATRDEEHQCRSALVLGAGPIGFLGAFALAVRGFRTYLASRNDPEDPKIRVLDKVGVTYFCSRQRTPVQIREAIGNIDVILEAAGSSELSFDFLPTLGINGIYLMTGVPGPGNSIAINADHLMRQLVVNNQVILGTVNASAEAFRRGVENLDLFCRRFPDSMRSMITARLPMERYAEVLIGKKPGEIKAVLTVS